MSESKKQAYEIAPFEINATVFIDATYVADVLKVTRQTVAKWIRSGQVLAFKAGRSWRTTPEDVVYGASEPPFRPTKESFYFFLRGLYEGYFERHPEARKWIDEEKRARRLDAYAEAYVQKWSHLPERKH